MLKTYDDAPLRRAYKIARQKYAEMAREPDSRDSDGYGRRAIMALQRARKLVADGATLPRYGRPGIWSGLNSPAGPVHEAFNARGRWIEQTDRVGLRPTDEPRKFGGWWLDDDGSEIVLGTVYQLPGRKGQARYLAGYADPWNPGAAWLSVDVIQGPASYRGSESRIALFRACHRANAIAKRMAAYTREHNAAYRAGQETRARFAAAFAAGRDWIAALRGLRAAQAGGSVSARIQKRLEAHVQTARLAYERARKSALAALSSRRIEHDPWLRAMWQDGYDSAA